MQQADGRSRGSPATTMEKEAQRAKKPRLELEPPLGTLTQVKKEAAPLQLDATGADGGGSAVVTLTPAESSSPSRVKGTVKIDMSLFECTLCSRPLKPPVFKCKGGHLACGGCIPGEGCRRCEHGGCFDVRSTDMDVLVSAARVECPHDGCRVDVVYHELSEHQSACPHAPCSCTMPGCGFVGPPPALVAHLNSRHSVSAHKFQYDKDFKLLVPASESSRRLLIGEDDNRVFLLCMGALGAATAVWVACIGTSDTPRPQYTCTMWSRMEPEFVLMRMEVRSSTSPGAVLPRSFLTVPPEYLVGAGASKKLPITITIKKI